MFGSKEQANKDRKRKKEYLHKRQHENTVDDHPPANKGIRDDPALGKDEAADKRQEQQGNVQSPPPRDGLAYFHKRWAPPNSL